MTHDKKMTTLKRNINHMQRAIEDNVDMVQDRTTKILQEQERDLLRAFRARLFDVQTELEQVRKRKTCRDECAHKCLLLHITSTISTLTGKEQDRQWGN